jgi:hypothetical protein
MRYLLWTGVAVALMLAGVGYAAVRYVSNHPRSWVAKCVATTHPIAASALRSGCTVRQEAGPPACDVPAGPTCDSPSPCHGPMMSEEGDVVVSPALLPGGLVMCEEPDASELPAEPMPPVRDIVGALPWLALGEDPTDVPMPRVEDDSAKMPRVECERHHSPTGSGQPATMPRSN